MKIKKYELDHLITLASNSNDELSMEILDRMAAEIAEIDDETPPETEILEVKAMKE